MVDCSHGNSNKDPSVQPLVAENCVAQIVDGNRSIVGLMLESHLKAGNQPIPKDLATLEYGVSITDPCIDWASTEALLLKLHRSLQTRATLTAARAPPAVALPQAVAEQQREHAQRRAAAAGCPS